MTKTEWKKRILTVPLSRDGRPVKELQGDLDMQSESEHQREAEIARAASERTSAEVKTLEAEKEALKKRVARLEKSETPLPEFMVGVDREGGDVGGNVKGRKEEPLARKDQVPAPQGYRVKITGDTIEKDGS